MPKEEILKKVIEIFAPMSETEHIHEDSDLIEDLGISSMDVLSLTVSLEEEFKITISEKAIRRMSTIGDVVDIVAGLVK